jgi:cation transport ATPase
MPQINPGSGKNRKPTAPKSRPANRNNGQQNDLRHVRWIALILSLGLMLISVILRVQPSLLPKGSDLASDAFGKVGIVLLCVWLAWPAIEIIWRAPSGAALVLASVVALGLFVYRPKTIYLTGPFLAIATVLALLLGWLRKLNR